MFVGSQRVRSVDIATRGDDPPRDPDGPRLTSNSAGVAQPDGPTHRAPRRRRPRQVAASAVERGRRPSAAARQRRRHCGRAGLAAPRTLIPTPQGVRRKDAASANGTFRSTASASRTRAFSPRTTSSRSYVDFVFAAGDLVVARSPPRRPVARSSRNQLAVAGAVTLLDRVPRPPGGHADGGDRPVRLGNPPSRT